MPDYDPGLQHHHLLPRQLLSRPCFRRMFETLGHERIGFNDFRAKGIPLHRGPHPRYSGMAMERVGGIEAIWTACVFVTVSNRPAIKR